MTARVLVLLTGLVSSALLWAACREPPRLAVGQDQPDSALLQLRTAEKSLAFVETTLLAEAGQPVVLEFTNDSILFPHNWVLARGNEATVVALPRAALAAGPEHDYIPTDQASIIAHASLIEPGAVARVRFTVPSAAGTYAYICTFPGHAQAGMQGRLIVRDSPE